MDTIIEKKDLLKLLVSFLHPIDIFAFRLTCKQVHDIIKEPDIDWDNEYPELVKRFSMIEYAIQHKYAVKPDVLFLNLLKQPNVIILDWFNEKFKIPEFKDICPQSENDKLDITDITLEAVKWLQLHKQDYIKKINQHTINHEVYKYLNGEEITYSRVV